MEEKTEASIANDIPHIKGDIMFNIFLTLPAETLHNLKYACKSWFNLITNSCFVDSHHRHTKPGLLIPCRSRSPHTSLIENKHVKFISMRKLHTGFNSFGGSCNGLVLLVGQEISIANPATKEGLKLPSTNYPTYCGGRRSDIGMVYKVCTREYKVIHCSSKWGKGELGCEIFTVGDNAWKILNSPHFGSSILHYLDKIINVNDVAYWVSRVYQLANKGEWQNNGWENWVVSYDVIGEKFQRVKLPDWFLHVKVDKLLEIEGSICLLGSPVDYSLFEIWGLKDSHKGIWVMLHSIEIHTEIRSCDVHKWVQLQGMGKIDISEWLRSPGNTISEISVVSIHENGKMIIFRRSQESSNFSDYFVYDVQFERIRHWNVPDMGCDLCFHHETLVSCSKLIPV